MEVASSFETYKLTVYYFEIQQTCCPNCTSRGKFNTYESGID